MVSLAIYIVAACVVFTAALFGIFLLLSPILFLISWLGSRNDPKCGPKLGDPGVTSRFRCGPSPIDWEGE